MDTFGTRLLLLALGLLCAAGCGMSDEAAAAKDRESSMASWALILRGGRRRRENPAQGHERAPVQDEEHAKQNPSVFQIEGAGSSSSEKSPPPTTSTTASTGNGSSTRMLTIKASGEFHTVIPSTSEDCPPGHARDRRDRGHDVR